ncbi:hypothetical protein DM47_2385 [Burkholderia mallei]|nr:hypothetical protein DM75_3334 [Burkholderia mallei]KOS81915.1 hypothetical protein DO61_4921 [Burkholderia mallei]KOS96943.1 hypothetical protein DM49_3045 [Burkholderia mallei]KOT16373.1 hypothetical protein DM47_2385 [Burkholderia mallei]
MKTLSGAGAFMPARWGLQLLVLHLLDEEVEHLRGAFEAVRVRRARLVLALHDDRRHAVDVVVLQQLGRLLHLALHAERVVRIEELLLVDALRREEVGLCLWRQQVVLFLVDRVEHGGRHLLGDAERRERIEQLRVRDEIVAERHRHALERDLVALLLHPGLDRRLELVAVRAAVPEELDHLDLAGGRGHRLRRLHHLEILAGDGRGGRRLREARDEAQGQEQRAKQFFHVRTFNRLRGNEVG